MALSAVEVQVFSRKRIAGRVVVEMRRVPVHHFVVEAAVVAVAIDAGLVPKTGVITEIRADARGQHVVAL